MEVIRFTLPLHLPSVANLREHWAKRAKRAREHRSIAKFGLWVAWRQADQKWTASLPCEVMLRRVAPRQLDDDNLRGACKNCRDGIADALGIDDRDPRVTWRYEQRKGASCVEVEIEPRLKDE